MCYEAQYGEISHCTIFCKDNSSRATCQFNSIFSMCFRGQGLKQFCTGPLKLYLTLANHFCLSVLVLVSFYKLVEVCECAPLCSEKTQQMLLKQCDSFISAGSRSSDDPNICDIPSTAIQMHSTKLFHFSLFVVRSARFTNSTFTHYTNDNEASHQSLFKWRWFFFSSGRSA